jgi:hypothetical protein
MELSYELAQLAARYIAEEGLTYFEAKRKAAKQVGVLEHHASMPTNETIEQALREYHLEFMPETQAAELARLRLMALDWLTQLSQLPDLNEPCLVLVVGAVVNGTAGEHSPVHVQVYTDEDKHVEIALLNAGLEVEYTQKKVEGFNCPVLVVQDKGVPIVLTLIPKERYKSPPAPSLTQHPQAATLKQLQLMISTTRGGLL